MAKIGDFAPNELKEEFVERQLKPGQILYLFCDFTTPPKEKYLVLACDDEALLFIINSDIRPFIQKRPELKRCQVLLEPPDYDFLDHNSYIDCSKVIEEFDLQQISEQVMGDTSRIKGEITQETREEIIRIVEAAKTITISDYHKKLIKNALSPSSNS